MAEQDRVRQIQSAMGEAGVDAVVLRLAENIVLATRWYVQIPGLAFVVIGRSGGGTLLVPEYEAWADQAFACGPNVTLFNGVKAESYSRMDSPPALNRKFVCRGPCSGCSSAKNRRNP